jgi:hypothetical protein
MFRGLRGVADLPRSSSSVISSTEAARVQEGPAGIAFVDGFLKVGVGFVVAAFSPCGREPDLLFLTGMTGSSSLPSEASRMFRGLRGVADLPRSSSSITSSTEAARVREGPAGIAFVDVFPEVGVGFVVAAFFPCGCGPNLFFLTGMTGSPLSSSGILRLRTLLAGSWFGGIGAMMV